MEKHVLSSHDIAVLKEVVRSVRERRQNTTNRPYVPTEMAPAPEVYVALTPAGGIPGLTKAADEFGEFDQPGYADCDIYRVVTDAGTPTLRLMGITKKILNLSEDEIGENTWQLVKRDKGGQWFADSGSGSSTSTEMEWVRILDIDSFNPASGTGTNQPDYYLGRVQDFDVNTGEFFDRSGSAPSPTGTGTVPLDIAVYMHGGYIPVENDVDEPVIYLARKEPDQLSFDGVTYDVYIAMDGATVDISCHDPSSSGTAGDITYSWYAGRLIHINGGLA